MSFWDNDWVALGLALFPFVSLWIFGMLLLIGPPPWAPFFLTAGAFSLPGGAKLLKSILDHGIHNDRW
jgi:hypothetical protein